MKKSLIIVSVIISLFVLCACSNNKENADDENYISGVANPIVEKDSLDAINSEIGTNIVAPAVMGKTDERYSVISNEIAQYNFSLNGYDWTIRGAKKIDEDISGIWDDHNEFVSGSESTVYMNDWYLYRFFDGDYQYTVVVDNPENFDETTFSNIKDEIKNCIIGVDPFEGEYTDNVSQRATAIVKKDGDIYHVTVSWSSSASKTTVWSMECKKEDNKLTYAGENFATYEYNDEGEETICGDGASNNIGWFDINEGKLAWTGANEEYCRACVFEKN